MSFLDRFKNKTSAFDKDYDRLSAMREDPHVWEALSPKDLKQLVIMKLAEYGMSQDGARIPGLFALYRYAKTRIDSSERMEVLLQFSLSVEKHKGEGYMGLMLFLAADNAPEILSTAAMNLAVLFQPKDGDPLAGPKFVVRTLLNNDEDAKSQGDALRGILLLGDKRLLPLLQAAWERLPDEGRFALTRANSRFVTEGIVEFWLRCLESGCSVPVSEAVIVAIAMMPVLTKAPLVFDLERVLPAYLDSENPMRLFRKTSFKDYLQEIRPRLEAFDGQEPEHILIPLISEVWSNPDQFKDSPGETRHE